ncbi:MAG: hypothetical protein KDD43_09580, partial [Bdellovibrionales bacterium]|nr:hypothetical protein [Bdellovibrionales bacterium]
MSEKSQVASAADMYDTQIHGLTEQSQRQDQQLMGLEEGRKKKLWELVDGASRHMTPLTESFFLREPRVMPLTENILGDLYGWLKTCILGMNDGRWEERLLPTGRYDDGAKEKVLIGSGAIAVLVNLLYGGDFRRGRSSDCERLCVENTWSTDCGSTVHPTVCVANLYEDLFHREGGARITPSYAGNPWMLQLVEGVWTSSYRMALEFLAEALHYDESGVNLGFRRGHLERLVLILLGEQPEERGAGELDAQASTGAPEGDAPGEAGEVQEIAKEAEAKEAEAKEAEEETKKGITREANGWSRDWDQRLLDALTDAEWVEFCKPVGAVKQKWSRKGLQRLRNWLTDCVKPREWLQEPGASVALVVNLLFGGSLVRLAKSDPPTAIVSGHVMNAWDEDRAGRVLIVNLHGEIQKHFALCEIQKHFALSIPANHWESVCVWSKASWGDKDIRDTSWKEQESKEFERAYELLCASMVRDPKVG